MLISEQAKNAKIHEEAGDKKAKQEPRDVVTEGVWGMWHPTTL